MSESILTAILELVQLANGLLAENKQLRTENDQLRAQVAAHDAELKPAPPPADTEPKKET